MANEKNTRKKGQTKEVGKGKNVKSSMSESKKLFPYHE